MAGSAAGAIQSVVAAPLDALQIRFRTSDITEGRYKNMWQYGYRKLNGIGMRGVFAGWSLSLVKDSVGFGAFFATFEYVKAQSYYAFVTRYYGQWRGLDQDTILRLRIDRTYGDSVIKPHYAMEPIFLMLAGIAASITQQLIQHPIEIIQSVHYQALTALDKKVHLDSSRTKVLQAYYVSYQKTYHRCLIHAQRNGGWRRWLYRGFFWNTVKQVPSTSAGLVIFELVRRRYGSDAEALEIQKDGYDIILNQ